MTFIATNLKTVFKEREKFGLANFFDSSRSGNISPQTFVKEMKKADNINNDPTQPSITLDMELKRELRQPKMPLRPESASNHKAPGEPVAPLQPVKPGSRRQLPPMNQGPEANIVTIVRKLQNSTSISTFLNGSLQKCPIQEGKIKNEHFKSYLDNSYGNILLEKERTLLVKTLDLNLDQHIDLYELRDVQLFKQVL